MRHAVLLCAVAASVAGAAPRSALDGPAPDEALVGNVAVWLDATLYVDADDRAQTLRLATLQSPRADSVGGVFTAQVRGTKGDFVEVELGDTTGCSLIGAGSRDPRFGAIRLFVRRVDLAPVVMKAFSAKFAGGTRIELAPGVPVVPVAGGYQISLQWNAASISIPASSIGYAFTYAASEQQRVYWPENGAATHVLGKTSVLLGKRTIAIAGGVYGPSITRRGGRTLFPITSPCLVATVSAPRGAVTSYAPGEGGEVGGVMGGSGGGIPILGPRIPKGTALDAPSGRPIATTTEDVRAETAAKGATPICLSVEVGYGTTSPSAARPVAATMTPERDRTFDACAPADRVRR